LGSTKVSFGDQAKLPSVGISERASLLVYQWHNLPRRGARDLARQDENVPKVQGIPIYVVPPLRRKL
jgi:hypothetical protein